MRITGGGDSMDYPPGLYSTLPRAVRGMMESDFRPTSAEMEVYEMYVQQAVARGRSLDAVLTGELVRFNDHLKSANVPHIMVTVRVPVT